MLYSFSAITSLIICKSFFGLKVKGREVLPKKGPFILASNHLSNLDPVVLGAVVFPIKVNFLAKEELFCNKAASFILKDLGSIPLKRSVSDLSALKTSLKVLKQKPLVIFPQGKRTENFDNFSPGVGFLCKKTGAPVIVARIYGTGDILGKGHSRLHRGRITVVFARVEDIKESDDYESIAVKVKSRRIGLK